MSVAAATPTETKSVTTPVSLWTTGFVGGVYVLASLAVVFFGVPQLWKIGVSSWLVPALNSSFDFAFRLIAQIAALSGLVVLGVLMAGPNPPKGIRGSIFLGISSIITAFFLIRAVFMIFERVMAKGFDVGQVVSFLFVGLLLFLFVKFLSSDRLPRWSAALEDAGFFDGKSYKRQQGLRVRRLTILGLLLLFGSGVYTMWHNNIVPAGNWEISLPMTDAKLMLLRDAQFTVPIILVALGCWFAYRIVNFPTFADFLIATEAEINKVSWTPRARLIQDTIVVLITVFIITLFLFVVDIFWGWILSRSWVDVLPNEEMTKPTHTRQVNKNEW